MSSSSIPSMSNHNSTPEFSTVPSTPTPAKGQIKPLADFCAVDSPKKRTNKFDLFAVKSKKANKTNLFVRFWENLQRANLLSVLSDL